VAVVLTALALPLALPHPISGCYDTGVRSVAPIAVLVGLLVSTSGCVHPEILNEYDANSERVLDPEPVVVREVVVSYDGAGGPPPSAAFLPPSPRDCPPPDPVPFRLGAGRGALGRVDLGPCVDDGLPPGYVHMRVTFRSSGRVVHAAVESAAAPTPEALECIGEQLEVAMVPVFDGGDVTLSRSYFVN
jgi:hypothetical protein